MKEKYKKGFVLVETIVISSVVMGILLILYSQLNMINNNYNKILNYNNIDELYLTSNVIKFLKSDNLNSLLNDNYTDISACETTLIDEYAYCENLFSNANIVSVIVTNGDLVALENELDTLKYSDKFEEFINYLQPIEGHYVIVEFEQEQYAALDVEA